jgi:hypothetical protein
MKSFILISVCLILGGLFWWHEYLAPKQATLKDASACMARKGHTFRDPQHPKSKAAWEACLKKAETRHATTTLRVVGY